MSQALVAGQLRLPLQGDVGKVLVGGNADSEPDRIPAALLELEGARGRLHAAVTAATKLLAPVFDDDEVPLDPRDFLGFLKFKSYARLTHERMAG